MTWRTSAAGAEQMPAAETGQPSVVETLAGIGIPLQKADGMRVLLERSGGDGRPPAAAVLRS